jgi:sialidase-1
MTAAAHLHGISHLFAAIIFCLVTANSGSGSDQDGTIELPPGVAQRCLKVLREVMHSDEFWPSIHAAEGLTMAGHGDEVRAFLEPKLKTEQDDQQRCGLARELVRAGDWRKSSIMLDILAGDNPHGHVHAAESLYKVREIGDGRTMRRALAQTKNVRLQLMAAAALGRFGNRTAIELLRGKLTDADADTRRTAAWILARIGDKTDIPRLREPAATEKDAFTRSYFQHALAALGDANGLRALRENLSADDAAVRTYAATFAGDARALGVTDDLIRLLDDENVDVRARAAQSLLVLSKPDATDAGADISQLVYPATEDHPRYTEGSIVRLDDESLLYAATQFVGGGSDFSQARIVARRSPDGGRTWGPPRVLQESTGKLNVMSVTLRRLNGAHDDTIAMFYLQKNGYDDLRVYVRFSDDEAKTFGPPVRVTTEPGYHVMNNDRVTQLSSGRLLAPVASTADVRKENHFVSHCWLSDDGGRTWRKGKGHVDQPQRGAMEPEVIELDDGRVMMIVRTQLGVIATSYSEDGGDTWSEPGQLSTLKAPEAPATLRRIPSTGDLLLVWNNTYTPGAGHGGRRTPLTAAISSDEGKTWSHIRNLESRDDRSYAYTSLTFVRGRAVLSYWERNGAMLSSRFRSLPISWFYSPDGE